MKIQCLTKLVSSRLQKTINSHNNHYSRVSTSFFCTETLKNPPSSSSSSSDNLSSRVKLVRDPKASVLPVLREWVNEGRTITKTQLQWLVRNIKDFRRYHHALEISIWMTDNRFHQITPRDAAIRLELIHKVHGLKEAENFFNTMSSQLKKQHTYGALLSCYSRESRLEKAEATMTEMRSKDLADTSFPYNVLIDLYSKTGDFDKIENLMKEMKQRGISRDRFTLRNLMSSCIRASDIPGVEKILGSVKIVDWKLYSIAADGYLKLGSKEKALEILRRLEKEAEKRNAKTRTLILTLLITLYPGIGEKDELFRVWNAFKLLPNGRGGRIYSCMINSLLKMDDIVGAEMIFEEWESKCETYDFRVVNSLLSGYCKIGNLDKSESLLKRAMERGSTPYVSSWNILATGYAENGDLPKAVEVLKKGLEIGRKKCWPNYVTLGVCLDYLKEKGDGTRIEEILNLLRKAEVLSDGTFLRLMRTRDSVGESFSEVLCVTDLNCLSTVDDEKRDTIEIDDSGSDEEGGSLISETGHGVYSPSN